MRNLIRAAIAAALVVAPVTYASTANADTPTQGVCDLYAAAGTPCVAANSTTHALYAAYSGPLYTVQRDSDGASLTIDTVAPGGVANSAAQDAFCKGTLCWITDIADQTPYNNDLVPSPAGGNGPAVHAALANAAPATLDAQRVYGVATWSGYGGYADDDTYMLPTGSAASSTLMVVSGGEHNNGCCYDYGLAETNRRDNGAGHMAAVNYGGAGVVGVDFENGIWGDLSQTTPFVTAMEKTNGTTAYAVMAGNAQGGTLNTVGLPLTGAYSPLHQEPGMVLGVGGDISQTSAGVFYEGVITAGSPPATVEAAVQADITSEGWAY